MLRVWNDIELFIVGILAAVALCLSSYEMTVRYLAPAYTPDWASEMVVYLIIWSVFLGASLLAERDRHVRVDLIIRLLPHGVQRGLEIFNSLLSLIFCIMLVWFGMEVVELGQLLDERSASSLRFPMWVYYLCLPVGSALMALRYARRLYRWIFRFDAATMIADEPDLSHH